MANSKMLRKLAIRHAQPHARRALGFLGFEFRRIRSRRDRWMPLRTPRIKKRTALLQKLKQIFRSHRSRPISEVIAQINPILRGWVQYFAVGHSSRCFSYIREWVEKKCGTIWCGPASVTVSGGRGGVKRGCMGRSASSRSTELPADRRPSAPSDSKGRITLAAKWCRSA
jgi:group II intron maturase